MQRNRGPITRLRSLLGISVWPLLFVGCGLVRRSDPPIDRSQDSRIRQEVEARLAMEPSLGGDNIRVTVDGGVVLLHGSVQGIGAWQCALTTAGLVVGVRTVADYLVLERGPRDVRCLAPRPDTGAVATKP